MSQGFMSEEDLRKAEESRKRQGATRLNGMKETKELKRKNWQIDKERKETQMTKKETSKVEKAQKVEKKVKALKHGEVQNKNYPPVVPEGKQAIWHESFKYKNKLGNTVKVRGHWELAKVAAKPVVVKVSDELKSEVSES